MVAPTVESWGGTVRSTPSNVKPLTDTIDAADDSSVLVHGLGRSYGDVCLNNGGTVLLSSNRAIIEFDTTKGVILAGSGATIHDINTHVIPHGWVVKVMPGTSQVTLGGAIANDIHGKNHFRRGTFGSSVRKLLLMRSTGEALECSPTTNTEYYNSTIGGLGLTGAIHTVELQLQRISSSQIETISIKTSTLSETLSVLAVADQDSEYSVAWVDMMGSRETWGRGHVLVGDHASANKGLPIPEPIPSSSIIPTIGKMAMNRFTVGLGNVARYNLQTKREKRVTMLHDEFFHPLDKVVGWNKAYGSRGFFQYQFVVPDSEAGHFAMNSILDEFHKSSLPLYLVVIKRFGEVSSPGLLSFPSPGITFAIDLPNVGDTALRTMSKCDALLLECGGRVYPAKDARMSAADFKRMYPQWSALEQLRDPAFSSSFWKRVTT